MKPLAIFPRVFRNRLIPVTSHIYFREKLVCMMWKPPLTFVTLHYAYIITLGLLGLIILYPYGNLAAVDAYFFGVSSSTESGLNTVDVKDLKLYQQLFIYFVPIVSNLGFINIVVVVVRLLWFERKLKQIIPTVLRNSSTNPQDLSEAPYEHEALSAARCDVDAIKSPEIEDQRSDATFQHSTAVDVPRTSHNYTESKIVSENEGNLNTKHISFTPDTPRKRLENVKNSDGPVPVGRYSENRIEADGTFSDDDDVISKVGTAENSNPRLRRSRTSARSLERVTSSLFALGNAQRPSRPGSTKSEEARRTMPYLSKDAIIGRNSQMHNLSSAGREKLGGMEYRALRLLLKIVVGYFFGLHLFGAICLAGWIQTAGAKYRSYLAEIKQDATFPLIVMSFLAYAGNTLYPCLLRLLIWTISKVVPKGSSLHQPLRFLLDHPRRCFTLLFPSGPTWALFGIIFALNFIDVLLIITLDLDNPAVNNLPVGPRILAVIYQAASSRHTGAAVFNLAEVHPGVQVSLLVMMYISVFPIAVSIRASNTYEEMSLGVYHGRKDLDESRAQSYLLTHMQNQLGFDLWYIFLGVFCITCAEATRIMDDGEPAFAVFPILFEVVSAYGNVGLSLGYPTVLTSLCGEFTPFSKIVICAMMIRGRHRGLPYALDRAITLPSERELLDEHRAGTHGAPGL